MAEDPVALVARAPGPIGRSICQDLGERGYDVAVGFDQDEDGAEAAAEAVRKAGQQAKLLAGRLGDPMVASSLVKRVLRSLDRLDALVVAPRREPIAEAAASQDPAEAFLGIEPAQVEPVLQADLKGPLSLVQRAGEHLREAGDGAIVLVGTGAALRSGPVGAPARAAQAGLATLVEAAGQTLAPEVPVNAVLPGLLSPEGVDAEALDAAAGSSDEEPFVDPEAVAAAAIHLLEAPPELTGQLVRVDRGLGSDRLGLRPWREDEETEHGLPGLDKRVEPPDSEERIDLDEG